jgi:LPS sulfotransferase NodH
MFDNIKFPTLIISSPRTGSTILGDYISQIYPHVKFFSEPYLNLDHYIEFLEYSKNSNNYILKFHARDIFDYDLNLSDYYLMRIKRRNIVNQIASYYLADKRNKFGGYIPNSKEYKLYNQSIIDFDNQKIDSLIDSTLYFNKCLNKFHRLFNVTFDQDLWYEDIHFDLNKIENKDYRVFKTAYSKNYDELKSLISKKLLNKSFKIIFQ